jgi:hypothetical protein
LLAGVSTSLRYVPNQNKKYIIGEKALLILAAHYEKVLIIFHTSNTQRHLETHFPKLHHPHLILNSHVRDDTLRYYLQREENSIQLKFTELELKD